VFVFLDTVQYQKNGWQNRNRIKTRDGAAWLTVPVHATLGTPISEVRVDRRQPWQRRHLRAIEHAYADAPAFPHFRDDLARLYAQDWLTLAPVALATARWLAAALGIETPTRVASEIPGSEVADPTGRLIEICRSVGADTYLAGQDGPTYMDVARFEAAGITVSLQSYTPPSYLQRHGPFIPRLSGLDLLLNTGPDALKILRSGDHWE
jgi:hypothetical protein